MPHNICIIGFPNIYMKDGLRKMGSIKDRNGMDLTEAEDIKKRWQNTQKNCTKKDLHDPDNHAGVITHLEPDILEWKSSGP